jgi:FtsP/CotA-like multicopper oxidase with cupredoxin domain
MTRRELLATVAGACFSPRRALVAQHAGMATGTPAQAPDGGPADITLRIAETTLELGPRRAVKTLAYNGQVPGPLLRAKVGQTLTVDVWNDTRDEELVHWHGFHIPPDVDGAREEGTPPVPPRGGRRRYVFTAEPAGTRWYHSHGMTGRNLRRTTYTGQFGLFVIESREEPGAYDLEVPILLHEWEPRFSREGPLDVEFRYQSINGRMLGAGEPVRVRQGQRVLFRIVNTSATLIHRLALPGHLFYVVALDGYPVPHPRSVPILAIAPGERIDAMVDMTRPGVWIFGEVDGVYRDAGLGLVVEYAGETGPARWQPAPPIPWDYRSFGRDGTPAEPDGQLSLVFRPTSDGHHWTINGKSHPRADEIVVEANRRYRWTLDNQSAHPHPIHLHRHAFELVRHAGVPTSGIQKDVVVVPAWQQVEIDVTTTQPGLSLFHCHQQFHMDMGFMALMRYSN